jgi:hypothetical protein
MLQADKYRECAAECVRLAMESADLRAKAVLTAMAERWRDLAEQVESVAILEAARPRSQLRLN